MQLRDYQHNAIASIYDYFANNNGNPIVSVATGGGKSVIIADFMRTALMADPNQRFLMATHVKELIAQNHQKMVAVWHNAPAGVYSAGLGKRQNEKAVVFGGIQSMYKKAHIFGHRDLLLVDECHLLSDESEGRYQTFISGLQQINPKMKIIGFTATPFRMKGGHLINGKTFTDVCFEISAKELIKRGYLSPVFTVAPEEQVSMEGVKVTAGDYNVKQMEAAYLREGVTTRALDDVFRRVTHHKCFLFFCAGVEHAKITHEMLKARGLKGNIISDKTPAHERDFSIEALRNGTYDYLCNNDVLTTGTDIPRVDCVVMLRSTKSRGLYCQIVGRGLRLYPGKTHCLFLDYGGNIERFGTIDEQPEGKKALKMAGVKDPVPMPTKVCKECRTHNYISAKHCISCNAAFDIEYKPPHEENAAHGHVVEPDHKPEWVDVSSVKYEIHIKRDTGSESMKVTYIGKLGTICSEWVSLKSAPYKLGSRLPLGVSYPASIQGLIELCKEKAKNPTRIEIIKNGKYYNVRGYDFT